MSGSGLIGVPAASTSAATREQCRAVASERVSAINGPCGVRAVRGQVLRAVRGQSAGSSLEFEPSAFERWRPTRRGRNQKQFAHQAKELTMSRRTNRLAAQLSAFVQQYRRKAQRGVEPNDRNYSREAEETMKRLPPEELSAVLNAEADELVPIVKPKRPKLSAFVPSKKGRGP